MAQVEFKITTWEKVEIKEENLEEVIELIKSGEIKSSNDLIEEYPEFLYYESGSYEVIPETEQQMSLEDNDGQSTIEVRDDNNDTIYQNGK